MSITVMPKRIDVHLSSIIVASGCLLSLLTGVSSAAEPARNSVARGGYEPAVRKGFIAFEGDDGLYVVSANGGETRKIPGTLPGDGDPAWSPNGRQIAFDRGGYESRDVYVMDADGSNLRRLTSATSDDAHAEWAPHGRAVTFTSDRDGDLSVYALDVRRRQARRVTRDGEFSDWAQNGRIVFNNVEGDLVSVQPYGAERRVHARAGRNGNVIFFGVRISGDDRMITYMYADVEPHRLYTARSDGSKARVVLTSAMEIYTPAWSPNAEWITVSIGTSGPSWLVQDKGGGERLDIYVVRKDGTELTRLTKMAPRRTACCSDWSVTASP